LQHHACCAIHVKLASRKPAKVAGIGRIEQQQRSLSVGSRQLQRHSSLRLIQRELKAGLLDNVPNKLGIEFEQQQLMLTGL
jgi:hypothetical protein